MSIDATEGARLLDSVTDLHAAVTSGDWAGGLLAVAGGTAELVDVVTDPVRELVAAGLGWLIEHVPQLREPFDALAGDPAGVAALAGAWHGVAGGAGAPAAGLHRVVATDTAAWRGAAVTAYRPVATGLSVAGSAAAGAAQVAAIAVEQAGDLVLGVRAVVRDLLARAVADLVVTFLRNVAVAATAVGMVAVAGLLVHRAVEWAGVLAGWTQRVGAALAALRALLTRLEPLLAPHTGGPARRPEVPGWRPLQGLAERRPQLVDAHAVAVESLKAKHERRIGGGQDDGPDAR
jgi:hypothetical protein